MIMLMFVAGPTLTECVPVFGKYKSGFVEYITFIFHIWMKNIRVVHIILEITVLLKNSTVNKGSRCKGASGNGDQPLLLREEKYANKTYLRFGNG